MGKMYHKINIELDMTNCEVSSKKLTIDQLTNKCRPGQKMVNFFGFLVTKFEHAVILTSQLVISGSILLLWYILPIFNCMTNFRSLEVNTKE